MLPAPDSSGFNEIEREAIILQFVVQSLQSMVNREMLKLSEGNVQIQATLVSPARRELFNVLFADLLERVDSSLLGVNGSLIDALHKTAQAPKLNSSKNQNKLLPDVTRLKDWLESIIQVEVWFPSIEINTTLKLQRGRFITICGNISKHNLSRLTRVAKSLTELLAENGIEVSRLDGLQALEDFQGRFQHDIFEYHSTTMAELLNNVCWSIHEYLEHEFARSYTPSPTPGDPLYSFKYPNDDLPLDSASGFCLICTVFKSLMSPQTSLSFLSFTFRNSN